MCCTYFARQSEVLGIVHTTTAPAQRCNADTTSVRIPARILTKLEDPCAQSLSERATAPRVLFADIWCRLGAARSTRALARSVRVRAAVVWGRAAQRPRGLVEQEVGLLLADAVRDDPIVARQQLVERVEEARIVDAARVGVERSPLDQYLVKRTCPASRCRSSRRWPASSYTWCSWSWRKCCALTSLRKQSA